MRNDNTLICAAILIVLIIALSVVYVDRQLSDIIGKLDTVILLTGVDDDGVPDGGPLGASLKPLYDIDNQHEFDVWVKLLPFDGSSYDTEAMTDDDGNVWQKVTIRILDYAEDDK